MTETELAESKRKREEKRIREREWRLRVDEKIEPGNGYNVSSMELQSRRNNLVSYHDVIDYFEKIDAEKQKTESAKKACAEIPPRLEAGLDRKLMSFALDSEAVLTMPLEELREIAECDNPHLYRQKLGASTISPGLGLIRLRQEMGVTT